MAWADYHNTNVALNTAFKIWEDLVHFSSVAQSCPTLCDPLDCSTAGIPVHHQLPEFIQTHVHRVSDAIQPSHPLSSPSPPAFNPSQHQGLFASGGQSTGVSASALVLSMNISGLISFRMDWLDLLAVQRTLKSLLHHHNTKASILRCSAKIYEFFKLMVWTFWLSVFCLKIFAYPRGTKIFILMCFLKQFYS